MNERIRKLMEQASSNACYDEPNQLHLMNDEIEKFAELVIAECANSIMDSETRQSGYYVSLIEDRFGYPQPTFGVEE